MENTWVAMHRVALYALSNSQPQKSYLTANGEAKVKNSSIFPLSGLRIFFKLPSSPLFLGTHGIPPVDIFVRYLPSQSFNQITYYSQLGVQRGGGYYVPVNRWRWRDFLQHTNSTLK